MVLMKGKKRSREASVGDTSSAVAACGIARTKDLKTWQRLPDLQTASLQQRNVVLHPEFVNGKYGAVPKAKRGYNC